MKYDADSAPSASEWLALDEQERLLLVEQYHRRRRIHLPNRKVHAIVHAIVENQLALGEPEVTRALARLQEEGLERHDAIHAVGSVLAVQIYAALKGQVDNATREAYLDALKDLTAEKWRAG